MTWKLIKDAGNLVKSHKSPGSLLNLKENYTESLDEVNTYFTTEKKLANKILDKLSTTDSHLATKVQSFNKLCNSFTLFPTDPSEICSIISGLNKDSAPGWDGISARILNECKIVLAGPIAHLCNLSFETGIFPDNNLKKITNMKKK
ncbi:unnamed protein product [Euphydryas editha]|uniref:Reverse transcriptase n=1 Tax=Euphydryas editha TaxID=104508 RepID=A0AAU9V8C3_EUPED|nr:unnamed protein product [Euphydryas editha]